MRYDDTLQLRGNPKSMDAYAAVPTVADHCAANCSLVTHDALLELLFRSATESSDSKAHLATPTFWNLNKIAHLCKIPKFYFILWTIMKYLTMNEIEERVSLLSYSERVLGTTELPQTH